jgi:hypothetical protein
VDESPLEADDGDGGRSVSCRAGISSTTSTGAGGTICALMLIRPQIGAPTLTATLDGTHFVNDRTGTSVNLRCISTLFIEMQRTFPN